MWAFLEARLEMPFSDTVTRNEHCFFQCKMLEPVVFPIGQGQVAVFSRPAPGCEQNEDAALAMSIPGGGALLAVADGAGGYENGAWAARTAIEHVRAAVADVQTADLRGAIVDGIEKANVMIKENNGSAGTTLVLAEILENRICPIHIGDSALLVTGNLGKVKWQTVPHSPTGYAVEAGLLSEEEALYHDERYLVSNLLGHNAARIEMGLPIRLAPRDTVLLASDGLFDNLTVDQIVDVIRKGPLGFAAKTLVDICRTQMKTDQPDIPSKPDDLTFVIYRLF